MFDGFERFEVPTSDGVTIVGRIGGSGPPLLLLHGNPLTHAHWHQVAPALAETFTVVATDLRGYGASGKPRGAIDHSNYSFRRMAQDQVEVMTHLGYQDWSVGGHDRGARVAYRMALDHQSRVSALAMFDILPTYHVLSNVTREWALGSFHWFFFAQPFDIPETLIKGHEEFFLTRKLTDIGIGKGGFTSEALEEYRRAATAETTHGICEDYRATMSIDFEMDRLDLEAGHVVECPTAMFWGEFSHTDKFYDPPSVWERYCRHLDRAVRLPCGHYPAEQVPDLVVSHLREFLTSALPNRAKPGVAQSARHE